MEDAEILILSQIRNLKAIFKDFSDAKKTIISQLHVLKAMFKNFYAEDDEEYINIIQNLVLGIAAEIISLLREHNARMQTRRKEWWQAQGSGIIDEFKAHKILVKAAVKRANENLKDSTSNSLSSQESNASEDYEVVEVVKGDRDKVQFSDIERIDENCDKPKETEDIRLFKYDDKLDDTHNDENLARKEDYEVVEKVKADVYKVKFSETEENDENYDEPKENEEVCLIKCEDKPIEIPGSVFEDEESSYKGSASQGIFFHDGCRSNARGRLDLNKDPADDDTGSRMDENADVPLGKKVNNDHRPCEGSIDEDPKVEEGYDGVNAEVPVSNENVLFVDSMVTTTRESFPNDIPAYRFASEIDPHQVHRLNLYLDYNP